MATIAVLLDMPKLRDKLVRVPHEIRLPAPTIALENTDPSQLLVHNADLSELAERPRSLAIHLLLDKSLPSYELAILLAQAAPNYDLSPDEFDVLDERVRFYVGNLARQEDPYLQTGERGYQHTNPRGRQLRAAAGLVAMHWLDRPQLSAKLYTTSIPKNATPKDPDTTSKTARLGMRLCVLDAMRTPISGPELLIVTGLTVNQIQKYRKSLEDDGLVIRSGKVHQELYQVDPNLLGAVEQALAELHSLADPAYTKKLQKTGNKIVESRELIGRLAHAALEGIFGPPRPPARFFPSALPHTTPPAIPAPAKRAIRQLHIITPPATKLSEAHPKNLLPLNTALEHVSFNPRALAIHMAMATATQKPILARDLTDVLITAAAPDFKVPDDEAYRSIRQAIFLYLHFFTDHTQPYFVRSEQGYGFTKRGLGLRATVGRQAVTWLNPTPTTSALYPSAPLETPIAFGNRMAVLHAFFVRSTIAEAAETLHTTRGVVTHHRARLEQEGLLVRYGNSRATHYEVTPNRGKRADIKETLAGLHDLTSRTQRMKLARVALRIGGNPDIFRLFAASALRNILVDKERPRVSE